LTTSTGGGPRQRPAAAAFFEAPAKLLCDNERATAMPGLDTPLHLEMYRRFRRHNTWPARLGRAIQGAWRELVAPPVYGMAWGDPEKVPPLRFIRDRYLLPYVNPAHTAVEIGPGGGRWTRYLLRFGRLYLVDFHAEILAEAQRAFRRHSHLVFLVNQGHDFPGIPPASVDFLFSFGTFVHLELPIIAAYLAAMRGILKPGANAVLQYSDKRKIMAQLNSGFADTTPEQVRREVERAGFEVLEEDLTTLWHSSVIRFRPAAAASQGKDNPSP